MTTRLDLFLYSTFKLSFSVTATYQSHLADRVSALADLYRLSVRRKATEAPSEDPSEDRDGEEAGTHHPRTAVVVTTTPVGAAASPAASRTAEVRTGVVVEGPVALLEAISEASPGLGGRL